MSKLIGTLGILNVGEGDVTISFDPQKPAERKRAAKIVGDMIKRGFAILVKVGEDAGEAIYKRAKAFDPETCEYIVAGDVSEEELTAKKPKKQTPPPVRVPAARTMAVAVGRSAGGYDPILPHKIRRGLRDISGVIG